MRNRNKKKNDKKKAGSVVEFWSVRLRGVSFSIQGLFFQRKEKKTIPQRTNGLATENNGGGIARVLVGQA